VNGKTLGTGKGCVMGQERLKGHGALMTMYHLCCKL